MGRVESKWFESLSLLNLENSLLNSYLRKYRLDFPLWVLGACSGKGLTPFSHHIHVLKSWCSERCHQGVVRPLGWRDCWESLRYWEQALEGECESLLLQFIINYSFLHKGSVLVVLVSLTQAKAVRDEGTAVEGSLPQIGLQTFLWGIFIVADWCKRFQPTMGGDIPRQVGLDCTRKVAEHARSNKQISGVFLCDFCFKIQS